MLTIEQKSNILKITWNLDDPVAIDLTEFEVATQVNSAKEVKDCFYYLIGERRPSLLSWRQFTISFKELLTKEVRFHFTCTHKSIFDWLNEIGFSLIGEVLLDPTASKDSSSK